MGISLEQYRARTGCFAQRGPDIQQKNQPVKRKERKEKEAVTAETKPPVSTTTAATSVSTKGKRRRERHAQLPRLLHYTPLLFLWMPRFAASGDDAEDNTTDTCVSTAVPVESTTNNVADAQTDGKDGGESSNNETTDAPAGALTTQTKPDGEGATVEEQATPAATSESVSQEGAASTDAPQDSTSSSAPDCRGDVCGEETDKRNQNVKREQFDKVQEKADMAITVELFKATKPRKENPVTPCISLHGTGKSSFIKRISPVCLIYLLYWMPAMAVAELEAVATYTLMYNKPLVSSCIPMDSKNISAVHEFYVNILKKRKNTDAIWLPMERRDLGGWYWLSGEYEGPTLPGGALNRGYCVAFLAADMVFEGFDCNRQLPKYLCQKTGSTCEVDESNCFHYNGTKYTIMVEKGSWYEALGGCTKRGEQLASLEKANRKGALEIIHQMTSSYHDIWVGLRRMDYFIATGSTSVDTYYWQKKGPCPCISPHNCLALQRTKENVIFWTPRSCSDRIASIVCDQRTRPEKSTRNGHVTPGRGNPGCFGIAISVIPLNAVLLLLVVIRIFRRCRDDFVSGVMVHATKVLEANAATGISQPGLEKFHEEKAKEESDSGYSSARSSCVLEVSNMQGQPAESGRETVSKNGAKTTTNGVFQPGFATIHEEKAEDESDSGQKTVWKNERRSGICNRMTDSGCMKWASPQHLSLIEGLIFTITSLTIILITGLVKSCFV